MIRIDSDGAQEDVAASGLEATATPDRSVRAGQEEHAPGIFQVVGGQAGAFQERLEGGVASISRVDADHWSFSAISGAQQTFAAPTGAQISGCPAQQSSIRNRTSSPSAS